MMAEGKTGGDCDRPDRGEGLPWYRHRWPWILMAGPAVVVIAGAITVWLAVKSNDGLVTEDYYKKGLAINQALAKADHARTLGLAARLKIVSGGIDVMLQSDKSAPLPEQIVVVLSHPTRAGMDRSVALNATGAGRYAGSLDLPAAGRWQVTVSDHAQTWRLSSVMRVPEETDITLSPAQRLGER